MQIDNNDVMSLCLNKLQVFILWIFLFYIFIPINLNMGFFFKKYLAKILTIIDQ
jgi:hypothetical protein